MFVCIDEAFVAKAVKAARTRVVLCIPGFGDAVGTALIEAHNRLPAGHMKVVVDGTAKAARLGYGHFEAVFQVAQAGVLLCLEEGLRLGVMVIDDRGWCFATPPLLVDATMQQAVAPNALVLTDIQIQSTLNALGFVAGQGTETSNADGAQGSNAKATATAGTLGRVVATVESLRPVQDTLLLDPPQAFDLARKVQVFNSFIDFVEIEMTGTQLAHQKVSLPAKLLLSIADDETRKRLTTSFSLIAPQAKIAEKAKELRQSLDGIRKLHTRSVNPFGVISLRVHKQALMDAIDDIKRKVKEYSEHIKDELKKEIEKSRKQLVESFLPAISKKPPEELSFSIIGKPTKEHVRRWIEVQLDKSFPSIDSLLGEMEVRCVIKSVTYQMLSDPKFQKLVREAYPDIDWNKPFEEFEAVPVQVQAPLKY